MIKTNICRIILIGSLLMTGCSTFIRDEDSERISLKYQAGEFVLQQDLNRNDVIFPKNSVVKLIVLTGDDWIKIYAYKAEEELLASNRLLLLFLFEEDFPSEKFSQEFLDSELSKIVRQKGTSEHPKKAIKTETKKVKK